MMEKLRIDKYLWAIRIFKTRSQATAAIEENKVKWNGNAVKPARPVSLGDRYTIKTPASAAGLIRVEATTGLLHNRVSFEEAVKNYTDITSEEEWKQTQSISRWGPASIQENDKARQDTPPKKQRRDP